MDNKNFNQIPLDFEFKPLLKIIPQNKLDFYQSLIETDRAVLYRYLSTCKSDNDLVINLFEYENQVVNSLYVQTSQIEMSLKSQLNNILLRQFGQNWYNDASFLRDFKEQDKVRRGLLKYQDYCKLYNKTPSLGDFIAHHTDFGYWTAILKAGQLWDNCRSVFNNDPNTKVTTLNKKSINRYLKSIRLLRNKIAHQGQILCCSIDHKDKSYYSYLIDVYNYICFIRRLLGVDNYDLSLIKCSDSKFKEIYDHYAFLAEEPFKEVGNKTNSF